MMGLAIPICIISITADSGMNGGIKTAGKECKKPIREDCLFTDWQRSGYGRMWSYDQVAFARRLGNSAVQYPQRAAHCALLRYSAAVLSIDGQE
jgi:hypothetical protein